MVLLCLCITVFCTSAAASDFESRLDEDGSFLNRLRLDNGNCEFGLISSVSGDGIEFIEPYYRSVNFLAGRLVLKGIVRELYTPDSSASTAAVFTENGTTALTASFSRSSRAGAAFYPYGADGLAVWAFRSNSGNLSCGAASCLPAVPKLSIACLAGRAGGTEPSQWFGQQQVLPAQLILHPAAELTLSGPGDPGTPGNAATPDTAAAAGNAGTAGTPGTAAAAAASRPELSLSILAAAGLPQYTPPSGTARIFGSLNRGCLGLRGLLRCTGAEYISPAGAAADELLAAGAAASFESCCGSGRDTSGEADGLCFSAEASYDYKLMHPGIIPSRVYPSSEELHAETGITARMLLLQPEVKLEAEISRNREADSTESVDAGGGAELGFTGRSFTAGLEYGIDACDIYSFDYSLMHSFCAEIDYKAEKVSAGVRMKYDENGVSLSADADAEFPGADVDFGVRVNSEGKVGIEFGFFTSW